MTILLTKSRTVLSMLLIVVASASVQSQAKKDRFDPDGSFWIFGKAPDEFSDFGGINLNAKRLRNIPTAGVQLHDGRNLRFKLLSVKQERFTFTTVALSNISYAFVGKFLRGGIYQASNLDDEKPVLEGVLTKYSGGRKVAEAKLQFVYFGGT
jgi:hypothetical protein